MSAPLPPLRLPACFQKSRKRGVASTGRVGFKLSCDPVAPYLFGPGLFFFSHCSKLYQVTF